MYTIQTHMLVHIYPVEWDADKNHMSFFAKEGAHPNVS